MKYYIISGEASGDLHGSNLMKGIYAEDPQADIRFWGGDLMSAVWSTFQDRATPLAAGVASEKQMVQWTFAARSHDSVVGGVVFSASAPGIASDGYY